jgi:hypothetical protein
MTQDEHDELEVLKFELKFIENDGYGRSTRTPWRPREVALASRLRSQIRRIEQQRARQAEMRVTDQKDDEYVKLAET